MKTQNNTIKKEFGLRVRMFRSQAKLSQEQLAEMAHMHPTYVSSIETGKTSLGLVKIIHLAKALGVSPKDLMP